MLLSPPEPNSPSASAPAQAWPTQNLCTHSAFRTSTLILLLHLVNYQVHFKSPLTCDSSTHSLQAPAASCSSSLAAHITLFGHHLFPHQTESHVVGDGSTWFTISPASRTVSTWHNFVECSNDVPVVLLEKHQPADLSIPLLSGACP